MEKGVKRMKDGMLRIGWIGAGGVNFGGVDPGAPWDHASRLETLAHSLNLKFIGIYDVDVKRAESVLDLRRKKMPHLWRETRLFGSYLELLEAVDAVFIGVPPGRHGTMEGDCVKHGVHIFLEKPIGIGSPEDVERVHTVRDSIEQAPSIVCSVGYMLRYSAGFNRLVELLCGQRIVAIHARYNCAYTAIPKPFWWDVRESGGPVIEQATHFIDALRFIGGDVDHDSVSAICVEPRSPAGHLSQIPCAEPTDPLFQIPRATCAVMRFKDSGAIATLCHGLTMQGTDYSTEFEVWTDGGRFVLRDAYDMAKCTLNANGKEIRFNPQEDMYLEEDRAFLEAVVNEDKRWMVRSPYRDAVSTYELSVLITQKSRTPPPHTK